VTLLLLLLCRIVHEVHIKETKTRVNYTTKSDVHYLYCLVYACIAWPVGACVAKLTAAAVATVMAIYTHHHHHHHRLEHL